MVEDWWKANKFPMLVAAIIIGTILVFFAIAVIVDVVREKREQRKRLDQMISDEKAKQKP